MMLIASSKKISNALESRKARLIFFKGGTRLFVCFRIFQLFNLKSLFRTLTKPYDGMKLKIFKSAKALLEEFRAVKCC